MSDTIRYRAGYRYVLATDYTIELPSLNHYGVALSAPGWGWFSLVDEELTIHENYAWDGPSGPAFDTPNFMRASLVHDALYQLIRMEVLPVELRDEADDIMRRICLEDGMSRPRAWWCWRAVRRCGASSAVPGDVNPVLAAPA